MSLLSFSLLRASEAQTVSSAEKKAFITVADLRAAGYSHPKWPPGTWSKTSGAKGVLEIEYEAETPNSYRGVPFYLTQTLSQQENAEEAKEAVELTRALRTAGFKAKGITEQTVPDQPIYGDDSRLITLESKRVVVGNVFTARRGKRTFTLTLVGVSFDNAKEWDAFAGKKIRAWLGATK